MRFLLLFLGALLASAPVAAQSQSAPEPAVRPATRAFALVGARVVQAPGRVLEGATVLVRDGRIEAVGTDVRVPWDAERIAADTLTVYAGFIDGFGHAGLARPPVTEAAPAPDPGHPSRERAGLTPERAAAALLRADAANLDTLRRAGFTAAQVVPHGGALPGQTALVLLGGDTPEGMVLRPEAASVVRFHEASGVYPATPMGLMATFRQLLENARRGQTAREAAQDRPERGPRPVYDPAAEALAGAFSGEPVVFHAEGPLDVHRALRLQREFGIAGAAIALADPVPALDALQKSGLPVFVSLALPDTLKVDTTATDTSAVPVAVSDSLEQDPVSEQGGADFPLPQRTFAYEDLDAERAGLEARRREALGRVERGPLLLDSAGVAFGFHTHDAKASALRANIRRYVRAGLSRDAALEALTTAPAEALGLDRLLGTVEPGKLANLVLVNGSYFDDSTDVQMVFVEGRRYDLRPDSVRHARRAPGAVRGRGMAQSPDPYGVVALPLLPLGPDLDAERDVEGTWAVTFHFRETGAIKATLQFESRGRALQGVLTVNGKRFRVRDVRISGRLLAFRTTLPRIGTVSVNGVVAGRRYTATATPDIGEVGNLTAIRRS